MHKPTLNKNGFKKVSPSAIVNYYFPMETNIPEEILIRAGAVGNIIHECVEDFLNSKKTNLSDKILEAEKKLLNDTLITLTKKNKHNLNLMWDNFKNNYDVVPIDKDNFILEKYIDDLEYIHGYIDYYDDDKIIDWKTNSVMGKKEIEKYTLQINLYRYMLFLSEWKIIDDIYLVHISRQEPITPTFKTRKPEQLLKVIKLDLIDFDELENMIQVAYEDRNKK